MDALPKDLARPRWLGIAAALAALALPAQASAAVSTFGSDLSATPTIAHSDHSDSGFWHSSLANGSSPVLPEGGQILEIKVKGIALNAPDGSKPDEPSPGYTVPNNLIHFQTLKPQADGTLKVDVTSNNFYMPFDVPADTITTFRPENMCAAKGDSIDLSTIGGWDGTNPGSGGYPSGVPFQVFASVPASSFSRFHKHDGFQNGRILTDGLMSPPGRPMPRPEVQSGQELLMQMTLGTGPDALYHCPGGTNNPYRPADPVKPPTTGTGTGTGSGGSGGTPAATGPPATIPAGKSASIDKKGVLSVGVHCSKAKPCTGTLVVKSRKTVMAKGRYSIAAGRTAAVKLKLTKAGKKLFKKRRQKMTATVIATSNPGGAVNTAKGTVKLKRRGR